MKYIDAEKLISEIEKFSSVEYSDTLCDDVANGALNYVLEEIIPALQQEQPEVDLEKEIEQYAIGFIGELRNYKDWTPRIARFARHFYELGLDARKV